MIVMYIPEYKRKKIHEMEYYKIKEGKFYIYVNGWLEAIANEIYY